VPFATRPTLSAAWPQDSRLHEDGRLEIGGCDLSELAARFGTPAYVVAPADIRARAQEFKAAFARHADDFEVHMAAKAFPCTAVLRILAEEGLACDVASGGELRLALRAGFDPGRVHLHGNAKSEAELRDAVELGVGHVVADNVMDLDRLEALVPKGSRQAVQLRIAPGVSPDTHPKISTGGPNTKFGFGLHDASAAIERARRSDRLELEGLHIHIGSQILDLQPFRHAVEVLAPLIGDLPVINLGGGLGVVYTAEQTPPSIDDYVAFKCRLVRELLGPRRVLDEPGRALVANSTVTLYRVETVKQNVVRYVAVDGGMSDNLRPMLYGARYEALVVGAGARERPHTTCHLVGKHCESGDLLIEDADLADPGPGDLVAVPATGAYTYAMANTYNGLPRAPVVFAQDGEAREVVRRETYDDLFLRDA
jgi:diaminopimelate decarboxylase